MSESLSTCGRVIRDGVYEDDDDDEYGGFGVVDFDEQDDDPILDSQNEALASMLTAHMVRAGWGMTTTGSHAELHIDSQEKATVELSDAWGANPWDYESIMEATYAAGDWLLAKARRLGNRHPRSRRSESVSHGSA